MTVVGKLSVRAASFPLGRALGVQDVRVELERTVQCDASLSLWVWANDVDGYCERVHQRGLCTLDVVDRIDGGALCTAMCDDGATEPSLFELFDDAGMSVLSGGGDDQRWSFEVRAANRGDVDRLARRATDHGVELTVESVDRLSGPTTVQSALTDCQRRTLVAAYEGGYYDTPRRATLADFGEQFDITPRAVSQRLRRGVGNLVEATLIVD
jgi:predicted DNA binding protein